MEEVGSHRRRLARTSGTILLACTLGWAQQTPEDSARQGWEALAKGDHTGAGALFTDAVATDPSCADAHAGLGALYVRLLRAKQALRSLARARELGSHHPSLDIETARARFLLKDYAEAIRSIDAYRAVNPESWEAWEVTGLCRYEVGDHRGCLEALSHPSLQARKGREPLHLYHLGLAHWHLGDRDAAVPLLRQVLERYPQTPYGIAASRMPLDSPASPGEDVWLRRRRKEAEERWWSIRAGVGGGFDTNPLSLGDTLAEGSLARRGVWFLEGYLALGARIVRREDTSWHVELGHLTRWHDELARFDQDRSHVSTRFEHWLRPWIGFSTDGSASTLEVGPRDTRDTWTAGASVLFVEGTWTRTRVSYRHAQHRYFLDDLPSAQDLDGESDSVGLEQEAYIPGTELYLRLGYQHTAQRTEGEDHDADFDVVYLQASHPLVCGIRATATTSLTLADYHHGNSRDPQGSDRDDDAWVGSLRLEKPLCEWSTIYLQATFVDGESNVDAFDYDRNSYMAGIDLRF